MPLWRVSYVTSDSYVNLANSFHYASRLFSAFKKFHKFHFQRWFNVSNILLVSVYLFCNKKDLIEREEVFQIWGSFYFVCKKWKNIQSLMITRLKNYYFISIQFIIFLIILFNKWEVSTLLLSSNYVLS